MAKVYEKNSRVETCYLGVDPGVGGGFALLDARGRVLDTWKMPGHPAEVVASLAGLKGRDVVAFLEFVRSSPQMGVTSSFTFGRGYGRLEAALCGAGIAYSEVTPKRWQDVMECRTGGDKNVTKAEAQRRWPRVTVTHAIADALLIAECCRRHDLAARRKAINNER